MLTTVLPLRATIKRGEASNFDLHLIHLAETKIISLLTRVASVFIGTSKKTPNMALPRTSTTKASKPFQTRTIRAIQSITVRLITSVPRYISNYTFHNDFKLENVSRPGAAKRREKLHSKYRSHFI